MSYDYKVEMAIARADELAQAESPYIYLVLVMAVVALALSLARKDGGRSLLSMLWDGDEGLVRAYWVYGVLGGITWGVGIISLSLAPDGNLIRMVYLLFAAYCCVIFQSIWRASNKFSGNAIWAALAKFSVVTAALPLTINLLKLFVTT